MRIAIELGRAAVVANLHGIAHAAWQRVIAAIARAAAALEVLVIDVQRTVGIDTEDVGDVDLALGAAAGIQRIHNQRQVGLVLDLDLAVTVEHAQFSAGRIGIENLAEQFDVAALHLHAGEFETVLLGVEDDIDLFPSTILVAGEPRYRRATDRVILGALDRLVRRALRRVVGDGLGETARPGTDGHRGIGRNRHAPLRNTTLHQTVDVEIARRDEDAAVGHNTTAGHFGLEAQRIKRTERLVGFRQFDRATPGHVIEAVGVALHEIAVLRRDLDLVGPDARRLHRIEQIAVVILLLFKTDAAGSAVDLDQAVRVADIAVQDNVRCEAAICRGRRRQIIGGQRIEGAGDQDLRLIAPRTGLRFRRSNGESCTATAVDVVDLGIAIDVHAVEIDLAAGIRGDRQVMQNQITVTVVGDLDLCIARRFQQAGTGEAVAADIDVAELCRGVADRLEVRRRFAKWLRAVAGQVEVIDLRGQVGDAGPERRDFRCVGVNLCL